LTQITAGKSSNSGPASHLLFFEQTLWAFFMGVADIRNGTSQKLHLRKRF
jgi:hypothetical protein